MHSVKSWVLARWRGAAPLGTVFWQDMLLVGTIVNAATTIAAIGILAAGSPPLLSMAVFLTPLPWNLLLFVAVWRSAAKAGGTTAMAAQLAALVWLIAATTL